MFSNNNLIDIDRVKSALKYYRSTISGFRPLSSMNHTYSFIRTKNDVAKLRAFEADEELCVDRRNQLRVLCDELRQTIFDKMERGIILHDTDIQALARTINQGLKVPRFNASLRWVQNFKKASKIVSRHITKIVSRRTAANRESIEATANLFVDNICSLNFAPELIVNADQSGFLKVYIHSKI